MAHSAVLCCGVCGKDYQPHRGGWSQRHHVQLHYLGLRPGAQAGDPLHDACYQAMYKAMRAAQPPQHAQRKRKRDDAGAGAAQPVAAQVAARPAVPAVAAPAVVLCPKGCPSPADAERAAAALLAKRFNAKPKKPIATLHAAAPTRDVTVAHVPKTQVGSADAGASTVRARSALVEHVLHAVAVPLPSPFAAQQHNGVVQQPEQQQLDEQRHVDAQRQAVVNHALPAYTAAAKSGNGFRIGPFTVDELMELKKFTGYVWCCVLLVFPRACDRVIHCIAFYGAVRSNSM
jgi:hypothetical protein